MSDIDLYCIDVLRGVAIHIVHMSSIERYV